MFISSAGKRGTHYADDHGRRLRAVEHYNPIFSRIIRTTQMLAIRLYVCTLTFIFLSLVTVTRGLGILEAIVITCAIVYLILDVRTDLQALKNELRLLQELEKNLSLLLRS